MELDLINRSQRLGKYVYPKSARIYRQIYAVCLLALFVLLVVNQIYKNKVENINYSIAHSFVAIH